MWRREAWERALRCVTGLGGELAQRPLVQDQCNESFGRRNYNSPSSRPKPTIKTNGEECSGCQAQRGAAKPDLHASPPTLVRKQHGDPPPAASPARGTSWVPPGTSQGLHSAAGSVSYEWLSEGEDGGMRRLSTPQASADTQGGLIHCPDPPPVPPQTRLSCEHRCVFARAGQEGCTLWCFSLARSAHHASGPEAHTRHRPHLPRNHIVPFPPEKPAGPPAGQAARRPRSGCKTGGSRAAPAAEQRPA